MGAVRNHGTEIDTQEKHWAIKLLRLLADDQRCEAARGSCKSYWQKLQLAVVITEYSGLKSFHSVPLYQANYLDHMNHYLPIIKCGQYGYQMNLYVRIPSTVFVMCSIFMSHEFPPQIFLLSDPDIPRSCCFCWCWWRINLDLTRRMSSSFAIFIYLWYSAS